MLARAICFAWRRAVSASQPCRAAGERADGLHDSMLSIAA
jgi:hypothetical protein